MSIQINSFHWLHFSTFSFDSMPLAEPFYGVTQHCCSKDHREWFLQQCPLWTCIREGRLMKNAGVFCQTFPDSRLITAKQRCIIGLFSGSLCRLLAHPLRDFSLPFMNDPPVLPKHSSLHSLVDQIQQLKLHRENSSIQFPCDIGGQRSTGRH